MINTVKLPKFDSIPIRLPDPLANVRSGLQESRRSPVTGEYKPHDGLDIRAPAGTPLLAVAAGRVNRIINNDTCGYGLAIDHTDSEVGAFSTKYCHMQALPQLQAGATVKAGDVVGKCGSTGESTGPHLHFELRMVVTRNGVTSVGMVPVDPTEAIRRAGSGQTVEITLPSIITRTQQRRRRSSHITPYIASLDSLHPYIQYELTRRRSASETANVHMPFVKLTSLLYVEGKDLGGGAQNSSPRAAQFPTLGIHGQTSGSDGGRGTLFEDIYSPVDGRSIVGYATSPDLLKYVPVLASSVERDAPNIPMPGIVGINTERSTAGPMGVRGGLFKATINIKAYSVGQLNTLLKYFLRPATRVMLEFGRTSSSNYERDFAVQKSVGGQTFFKKFDWKRLITEINREDKLDKMMKGEEGQREFIEKYIYNNFGDYEIFLGYVVSFKLNYTKDNVYDIELLVHSVQQFEIATKNTGVQSNTPAVPDICKSADLVDYFNPNSYWRQNSFIKLLTDYQAITDGDWKGHVISLFGQGLQPASADVKGPGFLVSWDFFVDVILNDNRQGLLSVFQQPENSDTLKLLRSSLIRPIPSGSGGQTDLNSNEVAWNPSLLSTDPNTMLIVNSNLPAAPPVADNKLTVELTNWDKLDAQEKDKFINNFKNDTIYRKLVDESPIGVFKEIRSGVGNLSDGIWLNSNAIMNAFLSTDTVSMALTQLLNSMNNATQGYWNLQLLSSEEVTGMHVIDMGMSKPIDTENSPAPIQDDVFITSPTTNFENTLANFIKGGTPGTNIRPAYTYVFNRKSQKGLGFPDDIGGELLDINISSTLPNVIAVQVIAGIGGVGEEGTRAAIDIDELKRLTPPEYDTYTRPQPGASGPCPDDSKDAIPQVDNIDPDTAQELMRILRDPNAYQQRTGASATERTDELITLQVNKWAERNIKLTESRPNDDPAAGTPDANPVYSARIAVPPSDEQKDVQRQRILEDLARLREVVFDSADRNVNGYYSMVVQYGAFFGKASKFIEYDISKLTRNLQVNKDELEVHPFNSSNLTKTIVDLTLPGIGGIQLFQSFLIDRVPNIIKRGFYIVTKVSHEFSIEKGWITKIQGRFRFSKKRIPQSME